jgi:hypothetical protein
MIDLQFKNIGAMTIWHPKPKLTLRILSFATDGRLSSLPQEATICPALSAANSVVDSGETVVFCASHEVSTAACAVHYEASVEDEKGLLWYATTIIANIAPPPNFGVKPARPGFGPPAEPAAS